MYCSYKWQKIAGSNCFSGVRVEELGDIYHATTYVVLRLVLGVFTLQVAVYEKAAIYAELGGCELSEYGASGWDCLDVKY